MYDRKPVVHVSPRLLTLKQAAAYLNMSPDTFMRQCVQTGEIKPVGRRGPWSRWMFDKADLDLWIEAHKESLTS